MISRQLGTRYKYYDEYENKKNQPYNYEKYGLLNKIISSKITNTNNSILRVILAYYEKSLVFLLKYIDRLKNFKNYNWVNR